MSTCYTSIIIITIIIVSVLLLPYAIILYYVLLYTIHTIIIYNIYTNYILHILDRRHLRHEARCEILLHTARRARPSQVNIYYTILYYTI